MTRLPKKSKAALPDFSEAQRACRTPAEHEQLALVMTARWTPAELHEFARLHYFRNGKDYATPTSYRRAIADLADTYRGLAYPGAKLASYQDSFLHTWLTDFRKGGSKVEPPRRKGLLQRGRGERYRINEEEYAWYGHTEEYRSFIEQRARDYFQISPGQPVHVNAWAASQRAYWREGYNESKAAEKATKAAKKAQAPKSRKKPNPRKLPPQFHIDWEGHTDEFREEVAAWARKDRRLAPGAYIGPGWWKIACNKHYELTES